MPPTIDNSKFSYAVIPDTQFYSQNDNGIFEQMTQWIADNKSTYNINLALHEGDLVNTHEQDNSEWDVAETAISTLDDAGIPSLLATGAHDAVQFDPRTLSTFNGRFPASRYAGFQDSQESITDAGTFVSDQAQNAYLRLEVDGESFIFAAVEFGPRDAVMDWLADVASQHADAHLIVVTHQYLNYDGTRADEGDDYDPSEYNLSDFNNGEQMWQNWLSQISNLVLTHNGHFLGDTSKRRTDYTMEGNAVSQQFCNYQMLDNGGDGILRLVTIDTDDLIAEITTYSTVNDNWRDNNSESFIVDLARRQSRVSSSINGARIVSF